MGNKSSRPKRRSGGCGHYKVQRDAFRRERDIYRSRSTYYSRRYRSALKRAINLKAELNLLKEQAGNPQKHKEKAKEMYSLLENRYKDRLSLISTQQNLLNRQNVILNSKKKKLKKNRNVLRDQQDKIDTSKRIIDYDMEDNISRNWYISYLKLLFLIVSIVVIALIVMEARRKK